MGWPRRVIGGLRDLFRPTRVERELDEELRDYVRTATEHRMESGMTEDEARPAARIELGHPEAVKEAVRDVGWETRVASTGRDLHFAARMLRRSPGFTCVAVFTLVLGIGATTAIFSVINTALLRPLPYPNPERLVRIIENVPAEESFTGVAVRMPAMNQAEFDWWRTNLTRLSELAVIAPQPYTLPTSDGNVRLAGARVSPDLFPMRGIPPIVGRGLNPDEEQPGIDVVDVVVLAAGTWERYFGADPDVVNRSIILDNRPHTVVGVMPSVFGDEEFWVPYVVEPPREGNVTFLNVIGRLADGVTLDAATAEVNTRGHHLQYRD